MGENINAEIFSEQGYVVLNNVFTKEEVEKNRKACAKLINLAEKNPSDIFCNYYMPHRTDQGALYDVYQRDPAIRNIIQSPKLIERLQDIYAREFYLFENSIVYKPRGKDNEVPWHQDYMYMTNDPDKVIVWAPVDDVSEENGCMYVIPGSHKYGAKEYYVAQGETHAKRTRVTQEELESAIPVPMKAGDVLVFHQFLLHSSKKVDSTLPRRSIRFAIKSLDNSYTPRATPIMLTEAITQTALLKPYQETKPSFINKVGGYVERLGKKLRAA